MSFSDVNAACGHDPKGLTPQQAAALLGFFPTKFHRRHVSRWLEDKGYREFVVDEYGEILGHLGRIPFGRGEEQREQLGDALAEMEVAYSLAEAGIRLCKYHPKVGTKVLELLCAVGSKAFYVEVKRIRLSQNERQLTELQQGIRSAVARVESRYWLDIWLWSADWDCRELFQHAGEIAAQCVQIVAQLKDADHRGEMIPPIPLTVDGRVPFGKVLVSLCPEKETSETLCSFGVQQGSNRRGPPMNPCCCVTA